MELTLTPDEKRDEADIERGQADIARDLADIKRNVDAKVFADVCAANHHAIEGKLKIIMWIIGGSGALALAIFSYIVKISAQHAETKALLDLIIRKLGM